MQREHLRRLGMLRSSTLIVAVKRWIMDFNSELSPLASLRTPAHSTLFILALLALDDLLSFFRWLLYLATQAV